MDYNNYKSLYKNLKTKIEITDNRIKFDDMHKKYALHIMAIIINKQKNENIDLEQISNKFIKLYHDAKFEKANDITIFTSGLLSDLAIDVPFNKLQILIYYFENIDKLYIFSKQKLQKLFAQYNQDIAQIYQRNLSHKNYGRTKISNRYYDFYEYLNNLDLDIFQERYEYIIDKTSIYLKSILNNIKLVEDDNIDKINNFKNMYIKEIQDQIVTNQEAKRDKEDKLTKLIKSKTINKILLILSIVLAMICAASSVLLFMYMPIMILIGLSAGLCAASLISVYHHIIKITDLNNNIEVINAKIQSYEKNEEALLKIQETIKNLPLITSKYNIEDNLSSNYILIEQIQKAINDYELLLEKYTKLEDKTKELIINNTEQETIIDELKTIAEKISHSITFQDQKFDFHFNQANDECKEGSVFLNFLSFIKNKYSKSESSVSKFIIGIIFEYIKQDRNNLNLVSDFKNNFLENNKNLSQESKKFVEKIMDEYQEISALGKSMSL